MFPALPPASTQPGPSPVTQLDQPTPGPSPGQEDAGFSFAKHAQAKRAIPKQDYSAEIPKPEPEPTTATGDGGPGTTDPPGGSSSGTGTDPGGAGAEYTKEHLDSARTTIMIYDTAIATVCSSIVDDAKYPEERFLMKPLLRQQAEIQLARGIAKGGGKFAMPWWLALCIVMVAAGFMNWQLVKKAKREKAERNRPPQPQRPATSRPGAVPDHRKPGEAIQADSITTKTGQNIPLAKFFGECANCGRPLTKKGKKYCGQSCAGQATSKKKKPTTTTEVPPTSPVTSHESNGTAS